jgi:hypothetical protein
MVGRIGPCIVKTDYDFVVMDVFPLRVGRLEMPSLTGLQPRVTQEFLSSEGPKVMAVARIIQVMDVVVFGTLDG